jgi:hypothetical protein
VKPTQVYSAHSQAGRQVIYKSKGGTLNGIGNLNSAVEKADRLVEQKLSGSQFSLNCVTNIISQLMFAFTGRNTGRFISMESL